jgi:hypothetical protein
MRLMGLLSLRWSHAQFFLEHLTKEISSNYLEQKKEGSAIYALNKIAQI